MKIAHLIGISGTRFDNSEGEEKYRKWARGAYSHMLLEKTPLMGIDQCVVLPKKPDLSIVHVNSFENLERFLSYAHSPEREAYYKDIHATWGKTMERVWQVIYQVVKRFDNGSDTLPGINNHAGGNTFHETIYSEENAPVILLRGLGLSSGDWEKYDAWVNEWAYEVYIPVLMKIPGVIEYNRCWLSNIGWYGTPPKVSASEDPSYPQDLAIIYFENLKAYQAYQNSKGLAAFEKNLAAEFPSGLNYKWNVVCQLLGHWTR
jgi:hypothetical protein